MKKKVVSIDVSTKVKFSELPKSIFIYFLNKNYDNKNI